MTVYESVWQMIHWLINEHFPVFLVCVFIFSAWVSAVVLLINYVAAEINAKIYTTKERNKYKCG